MNGKKEFINRELNKEQMEELMYQILEELYFIKTINQLEKKLEIDSSVLSLTLWKMIEKGLVKIMMKYDDEIELNKEEFELNSKNYHYIASKKGLIWHNSL